MFTLFCHANIYDGSGEAPFFCDVLVRDDRIEAVGRGLPAPEGVNVIDAEGLWLCPGFVDIHRHADVQPLLNWSGEAELRQGITTAVSGNCGISLTPCGDAFRAQQTAFSAAVLGPVPENAPGMYREYSAFMEKAALPFDFAAMLGTGAVRISLMGFSRAPFTKENLEKAAACVEEALALGAPGISCGIMYMPECFNTFDEYVSMLRPLERYNRPLTAHIRGEGDGLVESVEEVIRLAEAVGCPLEISHFKSCGMQNWGREVYRAIEKIEAARARGQDVTCDFYPYCGGSTMLTTMLPPALCADGADAACARLGTKAGVETFRRAARQTYPDWDNYAVTLGWDRILISTVAQTENRRFLGLSVQAGAEKFGFADAEALAAHLMHTEGGACGIINLSMAQEDVDAVAQLPYSILISDSLYAATDTPHPRLLGSFPRFLREYALERHVVTPETAIRKMTALPADRFGFSDRGRIQAGCRADLLLFDPAKFTDNADFSGRSDPASGLSYSLIGGVPVVEDDQLTGNRPGRWLRAHR
ncbi:MAG: amidohydrolase family protein [Ruminococcus bromii]|nr:amidohydrolase family protein [Ruminococcus bromii]